MLMNEQFSEETAFRSQSKDLSPMDREPIFLFSSAGATDYFFAPIAVIFQFTWATGCMEISGIMTSPTLRFLN